MEILAYRDGVEEPHPFEIELDRVGDLTYVRLSGDAVWAYSILTALRSLVDQRLDFVVDLRGLRHINDTNVEELLQGARWGIDYDLDVSFIPGSAEIRDEFRKHPASEPMVRWVEPPGELA